MLKTVQIVLKLLLKLCFNLNDLAKTCYAYKVS